MNELRNGDQQARDSLDLMSGGTWHAPRGWKTRVVVWLILALFAACLAAGLILVAVLVFG